jgi:hypothetical protein
MGVSLVITAFPHQSETVSSCPLANQVKGLTALATCIGRRRSSNARISVLALDLVVAHSTEASVDRVGCNRLALDSRRQVRQLLVACLLVGLVGWPPAGRRDKPALAADRIAVDMEGTAGRGCKLDGQRYNQKLRPMWHKPTNFAVFLLFSRSQPHECLYF